jgi:RimJ/RimL family protein N-acetyltransferase
VRSPDLNALIAEFGSLERVLAQTYGVMVLHGDLVVCEASTGAAGGGRVEIGVGTQELYRRRGLARAACAQLILHCEAAGYLTWWDCAAHNTASIALAHALGYRNLHEYRYQWWEATGCVPAERDAQ